MDRAGEEVGYRDVLHLLIQQYLRLHNYHQQSSILESEAIVRNIIISIGKKVFSSVRVLK